MEALKPRILNGSLISERINSEMINYEQLVSGILATIHSKVSSLEDITKAAGKAGVDSSRSFKIRFIEQPDSTKILEFDFSENLSKEPTR